MRTFTLPGLLALFSLALRTTAPVHGGESAAWECTGPYGGFIFRVEVDETAPDRVLAYTTRGTFLSNDAGVTWGDRTLQ